MKHIFHQVAVIMVISFFTFCGCSEDSTSPVVQTDQEFIQSQVSQLDSIADFIASDEATINDGSAVEWDVNGLTKVQTAITPFKWGRKIQNIQKNIYVSFYGDTLAEARIRKTIMGELLINASYVDSPGVIVPLTKQYTNEIERRVRFIRIARTQEPKWNWRAIAMTSVVGRTNVNPDFNITRIEVITPYDTLILADSLMRWFHRWKNPDRIPVLNLGDTVAVRVHVQSTNQFRECVVLRHSVDHRFTHRFRTRMVQTDSSYNQNMYTRKFEHRFAVRLPQNIDIGRYNAIIDAMSYGTLHDDVMAPMNIFCGIPYIVKRF